MFSQFKSAVEQLAQQVPVPQIPGVDDHLVRRPSSDQGNRSMSPLSSGQLAENALTSLRKSLSNQRSPPPEPVSRSPSGSTPRKSNLEERLRRAAAARASNIDNNPSSSPPRSSSKTRRSQSPASIPLPQSRSQSPAPDALRTTDSVAVPDDEVAASKPTTVPHPLSEESKPDREPQADAPGHPSPPPTGKEESSLDSDDQEIPEETNPAQGAALDEEAFANEAVPVSSTERLEVEEAALVPNEDEDGADGNDNNILVSPDGPGGKAESKKDDSSPEAPEVDHKEEVSQPSAVPVVLTPSTPSSASSSVVKDETLANNGPAIEELQQRLKQIEQRFSDVSTSFKRLQAEKLAADAVLRQWTPLETIQDKEGLSDYLKNAKSKFTVFQAEIKRLNGKLEDYTEQLEDIRTVHVSETKAQSEQIEKLRVQLTETEALFQASEKAVSQVEDNSAQHRAEVDRLKAEIATLRTQNKEEEEKRTKAISLLKTVRQKLVKAERDRDEAVQQAAASKDMDNDERDRERLERLQLQQELESLKIEKEKAAAAQKSQHDREMTSLKERYEKELSAVKGQLELDIITLKSSHSKEIGNKNSQISTLENSLNTVTRDKNTFFEQLQIKQAETESAQGHLESVQLQNTELEFQLREANDRLALLREEYAEYQREQEVQAREPVTTADDIAQIVSATESRYEAKLSELKRSFEVLERERSDSEANWGRKMKEKVKEVDELNRMLGKTARSREEDIGVADKLRSDLALAREEITTLREQVAELPVLQNKIQEIKRNAKDLEQELNAKIRLVEKAVEEGKAREVQLRQANKTIKEELRKVQSSAALLERQRNPGVGYWNRNPVENPGASSSEQQSAYTEHAPSRVNSPTTSAPGSNKNDQEEVNLEYLRNVILQFLEHKEMRPNLVKVMSIILHFTPQETRRLMAKV